MAARKRDECIPPGSFCAKSRKLCLPKLSPTRYSAFHNCSLPRLFTQWRGIMPVPPQVIKNSINQIKSVSFSRAVVLTIRTRDCSRSI